ncbi:MAG: helix-turn-helix domain-containing protein [Rhizomicrobium sp.]
MAAAGDWWTLLIVRDAFAGLSRFGEFQTSLGIARNILADRLAALTAEGILAREGTAARPRYVLTRKGRELMPALVALMQWGDKWQSANRPPVLLSTDGGEALAPVQVVTRAGKAVNDVRFSPGPGANGRTRRFFEGRAKGDQSRLS